MAVRVALLRLVVVALNDVFVAHRKVFATNDDLFDDNDDDDDGLENWTHQLIQNLIPSKSSTFCLMYANMASLCSRNEMCISRQEVDVGENARDETSPCSGRLSSISKIVVRYSRLCFMHAYK